MFCRLRGQRNADGSKRRGFDQGSPRGCVEAGEPRAPAVSTALLVSRRPTEATQATRGWSASGKHTPQQGLVVASRTVALTIYAQLVSLQLCSAGGYQSFFFWHARCLTCSRRSTSPSHQAAQSWKIPLTQSSADCGERAKGQEVFVLVSPSNATCNV